MSSNYPSDTGSCPLYLKLRFLGKYLGKQIMQFPVIICFKIGGTAMWLKPWSNGA